MAAPTQVLPSWLTLSTTLVTLPDGEVSTSSTILRLPLTYYGPSVSRLFATAGDRCARCAAHLPRSLSGTCGHAFEGRQGRLVEGLDGKARMLPSHLAGMRYCVRVEDLRASIVERPVLVQGRAVL